MNAAPAQHSNLYLLAPELGLGSASASAEAIADESGREDLVLRKLGPRAWRRLYQFRHLYEAGWGGGTGRMLSPRALEVLYRFIEQPAFAPLLEPSLFLTDEGHLELCWDDKTRGAVQIEFTPAGAEYYFERTAEEGFILTAEVAELVRRLASS